MVFIAYLSKGVYIGNGATRNFSAPFNYLDKAHVVVKVSRVQTAFTWLNANTVQLATAPAAGASVSVERHTPRNFRLSEFHDGSVLKELELNTATLQLLYIMQEALDDVSDVIVYDPEKGYFDAGGKRIANVGAPTESNDVVTLNYYRTVVLPELVVQLEEKFAGTSSQILRDFEAFKVILSQDFEAFKNGLLFDFDEYKAIFNAYVTRVEALQEILTAQVAEATALAEKSAELSLKAIASAEAAKAAEEHTLFLSNNIRNFYHKGQWQNGVVYKPQNVVEMGGSSYVLLEGDGTSPPPLGGKWALLARKGDSYYLKKIDGGAADTVYAAALDCGNAAG